MSRMDDVCDIEYFHDMCDVTFVILGTQKKIVLSHIMSHIDDMYDLKCSHDMCDVTFVILVTRICDMKLLHVTHR